MLREFQSSSLEVGFRFSCFIGSGCRDIYNIYDHIYIGFQMFPGFHMFQLDGRRRSIPIIGMRGEVGVAYASS